MLKFLRGLFSTPVYVRISRNRLKVRDAVSGRERELSAPIPFSTSRLLVGQFSSAEALLAQALRDLYRDRRFQPAPQIVLHPLEGHDGELSEVETRVLLELGEGAGGRQVKLWLGPELSDAEVRAMCQGEG